MDIEIFKNKYNCYICLKKFSDDAFEYNDFDNEIQEILYGDYKLNQVILNWLRENRFDILCDYVERYRNDAIDYLPVHIYKREKIDKLKKECEKNKELPKMIYNLYKDDQQNLNYMPNEELKNYIKNISLPFKLEDL